MRIKLLLIFMCLLLACQKQEDNITQPIDSSMLGIDHITINNKDYAIANSLMIDKSAPLVCTGLLNSSSKIEFNYTWNALAEDLSSVSITSTKAQVEVNYTGNTTTKTYTIRVYNTNPKAEVKYVISALTK
ncbi:hypothetical protein [uncultured Bacteroides sp.]|uniref:hypothetical protein n=1 Tax=uncultured Bacteroides sp. TaxID=162156 RepID=UPI002AAB2C82|nr:hypothetical protein [uncultured Bacteroides sp.]